MREKLAILKSEIDRDHKKIHKIFQRFEKSYNEFNSSNEYSKLVESAFYVSQLYGGLENIFKNVAKTFENDIEQTYWHKSLLERISLDIQDIRPALISEKNFECLNELRAFRHFFRHAYGVDIDKEKFKIVAARVLQTKDLLEKDLEQFSLFLNKLMT